jgi:hypothetical protein
MPRPFLAQTIPALAILFFVSISSSSVPRPQTSAAHISINATDPAGNGVQGAQIQLTPAPYPAPKSLETDEKGALSLDLAPGTYRLAAKRVGYFDFVNEIVVKNSSESQKFEIRLSQAPNAHLSVHGSAANQLPPNDSLPKDSAQMDPAPKASAHDDSAPNNTQPKNTLRISAAPYHDAVSYNLADLQSMLRTKIKIHNAHTNADETYTGVRLAAILTPLGVPLGKDLRGPALALSVLATGADHYQVVLALADLDPAFHPGEVIVADTMNGHPLPADSGPFRLVVSEDKRPARSVRNLVSIELKSTN